MSSDEYFYSIFGLLNPSADTQYIRVEALADSIQVGAPPWIDASVTLEHLDTGRIVALRDSFMQLPFGETVHNFWTAEPIEAGVSYRLRVERSDGAMSEAVATVPAPPEITHDNAFELPCNYQFDWMNLFHVRAEAEQLAAIKVLYPVRGRLAVFNYTDGVIERGGGFDLEVNYRDDLMSLTTGGFCAGLDRPYAVIEVTAAGPEWPAFGGATIDDLAGPDTFANVVNGHGLLGGVYTDTVRIPVRSRF